ncbi:MAG: hypothetical protein BZY80_01290 [SAR202 cluster bacterium Io17-Chloro-G2]|nr:MAG: hypothetical protein BZY80_01290 [SAR202 cluster bacterium Io17-Chloro-G2]
MAGVTRTFGVSGKLIMNALVMYDHQSDTLWSQFLSRGVRGPLADTSLEIVPSLQTTWTQWLGLHPDTMVLDKRGYNVGDGYESYYRNGSAGIIGESNKDDRLPTKELVVGLDLEGKTIAYPFREIANQPVINDFFAGRDVLVTFELGSETGVVFERQVDGRTLHFRPAAQDSQRDGTLLMQDDETSTIWQALTGRAIDGELEGTVLTRLPSHYSFWFAWSDFHPDTELYAGPTG